ncbi:hypothetical protein WSM22_22340 [Cytophagales bacterium WSM2-2]|nr:hypothetical protein WSM22_22340 [Cytophagales bacterium WSM2-2]
MKTVLFFLPLIILVFLELIVVEVFAQPGDTMVIKSENLVLSNINYGRHTYLVYNKRTKEGPAVRLTLVKINVEAKTYNGKPAVSITQQWDQDTVIHTATTVLDQKTFSTLAHNTFWKRLGYTGKYDFLKKEVSFEGKIVDSVRTKSIKDFDESFSSYSLNWHSDLLIFPLLPFKANRVFKINFYDPGFGKPQQVIYTVEGSETLASGTGERIDCWTLIIKYTKPGPSYQKFWISKKAHEVLKEEDMFNGQYRYKLKMAVSENN